MLKAQGEVQAGFQEVRASPILKTVEIAVAQLKRTCLNPTSKIVVFLLPVEDLETN